MTETMDSTAELKSIFNNRGGDWRERLGVVVATMREMSRQTDPQEMVRAFGRGMKRFRVGEAFVSVSRRDLEPPRYRITRSSLWGDLVNPWRDRDLLPIFDRGLLGELLYGDEPRVIDDLHVPDDDPAAEHLAGYRSLLAIPQYNGGIAKNMTLMLHSQPGGFELDGFPELVLRSNLVGQVTNSLVLSGELQRAYEAVDRELKLVADIQRSLLPKTLPRIPTLDLAAHYQTSRYAGGDYYDVLPLPDGRWGILIADVSGHGTPAAVMMAITHSIAHTYPGPPTPPSNLLNFLNAQLNKHYTSESETFVTAFYGIYDPATRRLSYASAGHNPPRLMRCEDGTIDSLDAARRLPLGIAAEEVYGEHTHELRPGDQIVFYTDGVTDAEAPDGRMFGLERLDGVLSQCTNRASNLIEGVLAALDDFTEGRPAADDRTLLVAKVS
jgi:sigma-B regulation protein RsbU (phosphoserine phosphatase)